jgi:hypothetical protein
VERGIAVADNNAVAAMTITERFNFMKYDEGLQTLKQEKFRCAC